jgi:hypothetical protein
MKSYFIPFIFLLLSAIISCGVKTSRKEPEIINPVKTQGKPASSFTDTIVINDRAAVFYYPDSMQLKKIEAGMNKGVFEASMHEYDSQLRVSHKALQNQWPGIRIIEAKAARFLRFIEPGNKEILVDLDTKGDPYGLIVFTPGKTPLQIDMMNADSQLYYYFSK